MRIFLASDHAGFELKEKLSAFLEHLGYEVVDKGPNKFDQNDDYPELVSPAVKEVSNDPKNSRAIILGGSGEGEAMVANRFKNVRAVVYYGGDRNIIKFSRAHNDANVLSLGARFISDKEAKEVVHDWLTTEFSEEERHRRRIGQIEKF